MIIYLVVVDSNDPLDNFYYLDKAIAEKKHAHLAKLIKSRYPDENRVRQEGLAYLVYEPIEMYWRAELDLLEVIPEDCTPEPTP